jgi:hypothetical protein
LGTHHNCLSSQQCRTSYEIEGQKKTETQNQLNYEERNSKHKELGSQRCAKVPEENVKVFREMCTDSKTKKGGNGSSAH